MSGFEIFSLIAAIIGVTETIIRACDAIKDLKGLPLAFQEVKKKLPLVEKTLQAAKTHAENAPDDESQALETLLKSCKENTKQLEDIFKKLATSKGKSIISVYRSLVIKIGKKGRVETLMRGILEDTYTLTTYRVFQAATQSQVEELKMAMQELEQVEPSIPDSDFEEMAGSVSHYGEGHIYSNTGSGTQKNVSRDNYEAARDMHFGGPPKSGSKEEGD
ncbi:uncharacterized protein FMAN_00030 [Fusarium mangiferae]|uniref:NACHT-NTPase and P-loop NTPases N-terminal domain-containing protein n=1 Tax=Fusarium mangiferae TaxID=192010 RepID=A0A1L7TVA0_FUSMA|nr:uncharacterized protein FMAN_00030 [Fusarium mangiferae]CVL02510.1 uncharacterized protein FMAN_00030 [Fusarium mangiferae]